MPTLPAVPKTSRRTFVRTLFASALVGKASAAMAQNRDMTVSDGKHEAPRVTENQNGDAQSDPLYDRACDLVRQHRHASISLVQRHLCIGYNRAHRLLVRMERAGVVSAPQANGMRKVLAADLSWSEAAREQAIKHKKLLDRLKDA